MLEVDGLEISFKTQDGWLNAVKGIFFSLKKGETLGIVGESGSGKSATALALMRLHNERRTIISGNIYLDGTNLLNLSEKLIQQVRGKRLAMIFQEPMTSLNPVITCGYQVTEAIRLHLKLSQPDAKAAAIKLFQEVQLPRPESMFDSYPHQLSGGQKQRVMIAMALSCNPEFLIADEPTTALDVTVQKTILDLLRQLISERGMGLIFISHDLGVVTEIADRVAVMYQGEMVEQAATKVIFTHPEHAYTRALLACRPPVNLRLKKLPVVADFFDADDKTETSVAAARQVNIYQPEELTQRKTDLYSQPPLLEIKNISTWFPVKTGLFSRNKEVIKAVDDVSFLVYPGETLGLAGESGSGKTTLGRSILRLIEPTAGEVIFDGTNLLQLNNSAIRRMRRDMQIIFQDPYSSLNPRLTVGASLLEPLQVHNLHEDDSRRREKVMELLTRVNLQPEHYHRYPHEFSGGQRQRIVIARALALEPRFIICDESVSALDISVQAQILNLLRELQQELNLTYIFISHDLSVIRHISDRIMVMHQGRIEEIGDADEVFDHPKSAYTKKLLEAIPGKGQRSS